MWTRAGGRRAQEVESVVRTTDTYPRKKKSEETKVKKQLGSSKKMALV